MNNQKYEGEFDYLEKSNEPSYAGEFDYLGTVEKPKPKVGLAQSLAGGYKSVPFGGQKRLADWFTGVQIPEIEAMTTRAIPTVIEEATKIALPFLKKPSIETAKIMHARALGSGKALTLDQIELSAEWLHLLNPDPGRRALAFQSIKDNIQKQGLGRGAQGLINLLTLFSGMKWLGGKIRPTTIPKEAPVISRETPAQILAKPEPIPRERPVEPVVSEELPPRLRPEEISKGIPPPDLTSPTPITQQAIDLAKEHIGDLEYAKALREKWIENGKEIDQLKRAGKMDEYRDKSFEAQYYSEVAEMIEGQAGIEPFRTKWKEEMAVSPKPEVSPAVVEKPKAEIPPEAEAFGRELLARGGKPSDIEYLILQAKTMGVEQFTNSVNTHGWMKIPEFVKELKDKGLSTEPTKLYEQLKAIPKESGTTLYSFPALPVEMLSEIPKTWGRFVDKTTGKIADITPQPIKDALGKLLVDRYGQPEAWKTLSEEHFIKRGGIWEKGMELGEKASRGLTPEEQIELGKSIRGVKSANPKIQKLGEEIAKEFKETGQELVNLGLMKEEQFKKYQGKYAPDMYKKYEVRGWTPPKEIVAQAEQFIAKENPALKDWQVADIVHNISEGKPVTFNFGRKKFTISGRGYAKGKIKTPGMPEPIKKLLGHIEEPAYPIYKRLVQEKMDIATVKFLNDATDVGIDQGWVSEMWKPGMNKEAIPNAPRYGNLRGKYVQEEIWGEIHEMFRQKPEIEKAYNSMLGMWKAGKVVLNPPTSIRNIVTNFMLNDFGGLSPTRVDIYTKAFLDYVNRGEYYQLFKKYRGLGTGYYGAEIRPFLKPFLKAEGTALDKMMSMVGQIVDKPSKIYGAQEDIFKLAKLIHNMEKKMPLDQALIDAEKWVFNYRKVPNSINFLRQSPLGAPFITFTYKAVPVVAETLIKHPFRVGKYYLMYRALEEMARRQLGWSQEDLDKYHRTLPAYKKPFLGIAPRTALLPTTFGGKPMEMNVGFYSPFGMLSELQTQAGEGALSGAVSLMQNPLFTTAMAIGSNKDYLGRDIAPSYATFPQKTLAQLKYAGKTALPTPLGYSIGREIEMAKRGQAGLGLMETLGGVKVQPFSLQQRQKQSQFQIKKKIEDLKTDIRRARRKKDYGRVNTLRHRLNELRKEL
mgnify:CR=1 FL=1